MVSRLMSLTLTRTTNTMAITFSRTMAAHAPVDDGRGAEVAVPGAADLFVLALPHCSPPLPCTSTPRRRVG